MTEGGSGAEGLGWGAVQARLAQELGALVDRQSLVVGDPPVDPGPPRGLLRRRTPPPPQRFAQVLRIGDWWYAESVGATSFGGEWEIDDATHQAIRALGWLAPGDPDETGTQPHIEHYWRTLPVGDPAPAARLLVGVLRLLDLTPDDLTWQVAG